MKCFYLIVFVYHIIILVSVFDVYFHSPIVHGIKPIKNDIKPPARRLVLFVGDGLRSDVFFENELNMTNAPYLRSKIEAGAPWGISYTRVPTESRPGHVAIIAGFYEDPSAVFKGWQENPVPFDSVFNQSYATFSWGSPDIVPMFSNEYTNPKIFWHSYSREEQDFSGKNESALYLNNWVYQQFKHFWNLTRANKTMLDIIHHDRIILFFHLLGIDVIGHIRKPNSEYYMEAIRNTDEVVKNITELIETTYNDSLTAYIFTSDHGMTDWGTHGAGSKSEIDTPVIAWGSGIRKTKCGMFNACGQNINQADITVLMSVLLGNSIPVHSTGILPLDYLDVDLRNKALGFLLNAQQLINQLNKKEEEIRNSMVFFLFSPYKGMTKEMQGYFFQLIQALFKEQDYYQAIHNIEILIDEALLGLRYYDAYFETYKLICLVITFWGLKCFVASEIMHYMMILNNYTLESSRVRANSITKHLTTKNVTLAALVLLLCYCIMPLTFLMYIALPLPLFYLAFIQYRVDRTVQFIIRSRKTVIQTLTILAALQLIAWSFFYRWVLSLSILVLNFWPYLDTRKVFIDLPIKRLWSISCILLAIFPLLPTVGEITRISDVAIACLLWFSVGITWISYMFRNDHNLPRDYALIIKCILVIPVIINIIMIDFSFNTGVGLMLGNQIASYFFLVIYALLMFCGPNNVIPRYFSIAYSLGIIFILFCSGHESLFVMVLSLHLCLWICIEMLITNYKTKELLKTRISASSNLPSMIGFADFRRSYFYFFYIVFSFFGTGNIDSLNSFDLAWVRGFVTIFSPYLITTLILLKTVIPFVMVTAAFRLIVLKTKSSVHGLFVIVLLFCETLGIEFLHRIQNYGSWLEIGRSISHFVIIQVTTLVLIGLYGLTSILIRPTNDVNIPYSKSM